MKTMFLSILVVIFFGCNAFATTDTTGPWGVRASRFTNLSTALSSPITLGKTVIIETPMAINNKTVNGREVKCVQGGIITVAAGKTLTISGQFSAGMYQVFSGSGAVILTAGSTERAYPQWFNNSISAAVATGANVYIPNGAYTMTSTAVLNNPNQHITGESRSGVIITMTDNANYAFKYESAIQGAGYVVNCGMTFENFTLYARYGIKLNQEGDFATVFDKQAFLLGITIHNCSFLGNLGSTGNVDPNSGTNVIPTLTDLRSQGVGIVMSKVFDSSVTNCLFMSNGVGLLLDGCDINNVDTSRFMNNSRHVHVIAHDTYGYQNKIQNCDVLLNNRYYGIWTDAAYTTIKNNYFETYAASGNYLYAGNTYSVIIEGNRFDNPGNLPYFMTLEPSYGFVVMGNTMGLSLPLAQIQVLSTYYQSSRVGMALVKFSGNSSVFPLPQYPMCEYDFNNPRVYDYLNPKTINGLAANAFPWVVSGVTSKWQIQPVDTLKVYMPTYSTDRDLLIKITGRSITTGGYVNVSWGGTTVYSGYIGFVSTTAAETRYITIRKPAAVTADSGITVELVPSAAEFQSIELAPTDYQRLSAAPTTGDIYGWFLGDRIVQSNPVVGQPKGWRCTVAGSPGTWVSEGNL